MIDPLVASAQRQRAKREAEAAARAMREAGPVIVIPTPVDVALGYRFIVPDEAVLPRNAKNLRNALRRAGWWAHANMTTALHPPVPATEKRAGKSWRPITSYGVHAFTSYPPGDGDIGLAAYWTDDGGFAWARRADYRDGSWRLVSLGWPGVVELMKGASS